MTITNIDAHTAKQWLDEGQAVLVDVREPAENASSCIEQAQQNLLVNYQQMMYLRSPIRKSLSIAKVAKGAKRLVKNLKNRTLK